MSEVEVSDYEVKSSKPMIDLSLEGEILDSNLIFNFEYNDMIFSEALIDKFAYNHIKILRNIVNYDIKVRDINLEDF